MIVSFYKYLMETEIMIDMKVQLSLERILSTTDERNILTLDSTLLKSHTPNNSSSWNMFLKRAIICRIYKDSS